MSLSRLYRQQGRQAEAQPLLAETCGGFAEGFDTRDLQEAKALLERTRVRRSVSNRPPLASGHGGRGIGVDQRVRQAPQRRTLRLKQRREEERMMV
jgi:hypothetical protein